ncbi:hypothetical protein [Sorangium sp. So ce233]|uniref:hypothetical protein n=1 Tax=Sorangium sp. So ce233 TaxID=3133290 RepID=UPI003F6046C6
MLPPVTALLLPLPVVVELEVPKMVSVSGEPQAPEKPDASPTQAIAARQRTR